MYRNLLIWRVTQVSVLSVILFPVAKIGVTQWIRPSVESYLYADDLAIYYVSRSMVSVQRRLQLDINSAWLTENKPA